MINLKTGKAFSTSKDSLVVENQSRRSFLKGGLAAILAAGVAPSLCGSITRGIGYRNLGGRLASMGGGNKEFIAVNYIQSYERKFIINTGVAVDGKTHRATIDFQVTDERTADRTIFGVWQTGSVYCCGTGQWGGYGFTFSDGVRDTLNRHTGIGNPTTYNLPNFVFALFCKDRFGQNYTTDKRFDGIINAKLFSCKIFEDDALVRDFVPCLRKIDSKPCLYDLCGSINAITQSSFYLNEHSSQVDFLYG